MISRSCSPRFFFGTLLLVLVLFSCKQSGVYEKNTPIPHYQWRSDHAATGTFNISDSTTPYNIYIVLRHTDAYNYNNIWLRVGIQSPGDSMFFQNIDLSLGTDAGGWEGTGMNDIWEVRKLVSRRPLKTGDYKFSINQIMRDNPLQAVMSAGLRVQKDG